MGVAVDRIGVDSMKRKNHLRYRGHVIDRMGDLPTHHTRWYSTYKEAYDAAHRILKKYEGMRFSLAVEDSEAKED